MFSKKKQPPEVFYKTGFLKTFSKFTGKHISQSLFFSKVASLRPATLSKRLRYLRFPVNFEKSLKTPILKNICDQLLLSKFNQCSSRVFLFNFERLKNKFIILSLTFIIFNKHLSAWLANLYITRKK